MSMANSSHGNVRYKSDGKPVESNAKIVVIDGEAYIIVTADFIFPYQEVFVDYPIHRI